jgi:hypothetical protein
MLAHLSKNVNLFSRRIYLSMDLTIIPSTEMKSWHDYNAFPLPNLTAQCALMDMSHYHEKSISRYLLLCGWVWCKGSLF